MTELKKCPVCKAVMNYNFEGLEKNPKAPTWKCSNSKCKFSFNKQTRKYEPSEFITGVWDNVKSPKEETFKRELVSTEEDSKWDKINAKKENNMNLLNARKGACEIVAAMISVGLLKEDIIEKVREYTQEIALIDEIILKSDF